MVSVSQAFDYVEVSPVGSDCRSGPVGFTFLHFHLWVSGLYGLSVYVSLFTCRSMTFVLGQQHVLEYVSQDAMRAGKEGRWGRPDAFVRDAGIPDFICKL